MKFLNTKLLGLVLTTLAIATTASAEVVADKVVAVVNNSVITQQDIDKRFQLTLRQTKQNLKKSQQEAIYRGTLQMLINEELKRQYANNIGITATEKELNLAIARIEADNNLSQGGFYNLTKGLTDTAKRQVETDILWDKVVSEVISPRIHISTQEVDQMIASITGDSAVEEKELYQVFISDAHNAADAQQKAQDAYKAIMDDKKDFPAIATAFGEGTEASKQGFMGWFKEGELQSALNDAFKDMKSGDVSKPIQTGSGWHILYVKSSRQSDQLSSEPIPAYAYYEMTVTLPEDEKSAKKVTRDIKKAVSNFERLGDMEEFVLKNKETYNITGVEHPLTPIVKMSTNMITRLENTKTGRFSNVEDFNNTLSVIYVMNQQNMLPTRLKQLRNRIQQRLVSARLDMMVRRFMRDLYRNAYVDVRL